MKNSSIKLLSFVLIILLIAGENLCCAKAQTAVLFAAGDTMLARRMHEEEFDGSVEKMFGRTLPYMQNSDAALVNLECVISSRGNIVYKDEDNPFSYRARPSMIKFLKNAGINLVSQANNHAGDYGPTALMDSYEHLMNVDILPLGVGRNLKDAREIKYVNINGIVVALIAFDTQQNTFKAQSNLPGTFYVDELDALSVVAPLIKEAHRQADIVIVSPHWGENWLEKPSEHRQKLARSFIDSGADSILGHSSHLLQGMEVYKGKPILYDMGSFLFDSIRNEQMRNSMFFELILSKEGISEIHAYPVLLNCGSVDLAQDKIRKTIFSEFINQSKDLDRKFIYKKTENHLIINATHKSKKYSGDLFLKKDDPKNQILLDKKNKIENYSMEIQPDCLIKDKVIPPEKKSVSFENGIKLLSSKLPGLIDNNTAFFVELYFQTDKLLKILPCEIQLSLYSRRGDLVIADSHEPGDWSYPTPQWKTGEIVKDFFLFRVPLELTEPVYELYLNIIEGHKICANQGKRIKVNDEKNEKGVFLGELRIGERNVNCIIPGLYSYENSKLFE